MLLFSRSRNDCAVVVANQVSDIVLPDEHEKVKVPADVGEQREAILDTGGNASQFGGKGKQYAAMGLAWAQAINTRIFLQRCCSHPAPNGSASGHNARPEDSDDSCLGLRQV